MKRGGDTCLRLPAASKLRARWSCRALLLPVVPLFALLVIGVGGTAATAADSSPIASPLPVLTTPGNTETNRVIVRFARSADAGERAGLRRLAGVRSGERIDSVRGLEIAKVDPGQSPVVAAALLDASKDVLYAEPDLVRQVSYLPNDEYLDALWGLHNFGQDPDDSSSSGSPGTIDADIDAPEAWDEIFGGGSVVVAIGDTGVDDDHQDLQNQIWINSAESGGSSGVDDDGNGLIDDYTGWDWAAGNGCFGPTSGDNDPDPPNWTGSSTDQSFHGSHVASTVGAEADNGVGLAGVNTGAKLMNLRIANINGSISTADELCSIQYAVDKGADVYNGSYGGFSASQAVADLINAHQETLFVFAAGNDGLNADTFPVYPCSTPAPNVICVAASNNFDAVSNFSNFGAKNVDLAAPGELIGGAFNTSSGDDYFFLNGTSMATPHVAGAASLVIARYPSLSTADVKLALLSGVDQKPTFTCAAGSGGRLNVDRALEIAGSIDAGTPAIPSLAGCPLPPPPAAPDDGRAPLVTLIGINKGRVRSNAQFGFRTTCNKNCSFTYTVKVKGIATYRGSGNAVGGAANTVLIKPSAKVRRKLLKAVRKRKARAVVSVVARSSTGNFSLPASLRLTLRR